MLFYPSTLKKGESYFEMSNYTNNKKQVMPIALFVTELIPATFANTCCYRLQSISMHHYATFGTYRLLDYLLSSRPQERREFKIDTQNTNNFLLTAIQYTTEVVAVLN